MGKKKPHAVAETLLRLDRLAFDLDQSERQQAARTVALEVVAAGYSQPEIKQYVREYPEAFWLTVTEWLAVASRRAAGERTAEIPPGLFVDLAKSLAIYGDAIGCPATRILDFAVASAEACPLVMDGVGILDTGDYSDQELVRLFWQAAGDVQRLLAATPGANPPPGECRTAERDRHIYEARTQTPQPTWKEIGGEVQRLFGDKLSINGLKKAANRHAERHGRPTV